MIRQNACTAFARSKQRDISALPQSKRAILMPRFSKHFGLGLTQYQLDFVDVSNEEDTPVYVDPYAIEISNDAWSTQASELIRDFFLQVLEAVRNGEMSRATHLMSHLTEPRETYLGVSSGQPQGRGVGYGQAGKLIRGIQRSRAFSSGILADLSEMALYVEGIDRDKISDLTTNVIRSLLVEYTQHQCEIYEVETERYSGPPLYDIDIHDWRSQEVQLPFIEQSPILLVPKFIVRRKLSLDSQEFYNKQITDFLVAEHLRANDSLVRVIKGKRRVFKKAVHSKHPKSKSLIADTVVANPQLLTLYKEIAKKQKALQDFGSEEDAPTLSALCAQLAAQFTQISPGIANASVYHKLVMGCLTALFYPDLINPEKEWDVNDGRKRIDICYTNAGDTGFFAQRRDDRRTEANLVVVECKNYSKDIANPELDQLMGRFDRSRGRFGILTCRQIDDLDLLTRRCRDAAGKGQGFLIVLTDNDFVQMLTAKSQLRDDEVEHLLFKKFAELLR